MRRIRFTDTELLLDLDTGEVLAGGDSQRLTPLSVRLLAHLVHNHDRVVPKEELLREVWDDARVSEDALRQGLRVLRRELGEAGSSVIENVRGRGYRLAERFVEADEGSGSERIVGRDEELASLLEDLESARRGRGRLVMISGPPGIGKTRLLEELTARAGWRGFGVAVARCADDEGTPSLWLFEQLLSDVVRARPAAASNLSSVEQASLLRAFPSLRPGARPDAEPGLEPGAARARLFEAVTRTLLAGDRPWLLAIDDLHCADAASLDLLEWLGARIGDRAVVVVAAHRETAVETHPTFSEAAPRLLRCGITRALALGPLGREAVAEVVRERVGDDEAAVETVWRESGGNPFLLRIALERSRRAGDGRPGSDLPASARDAVLDHLTVLTEPTRQVLAAASVLGMDVRPELLSALVDPGHSVSSAIDEARQAGLLRERGDGRLSFVHALVVEALRESVDPAERETLHARLVERLTASADANPATVAEHALRARSVLGPDPVVHWCEQAAREAAERLGFEDAVRWLERALACADEGPPGDRLRLLVALAEARARTSGAAGADAAAERAVALARAIGDDHAQARAVLALGLGRGTVSDVPDLRWRARVERALAEHRAPTRERTALLGLLAESLWFTPEVEQARALVRESLELAEGSGNADLEAASLIRAHRILQTGVGDDAVRSGLASRLASLLPAVRERLVVLEACLMLQWESLMTGDRAGVDEWNARLVRESEAVGGPHASWWAGVSRASLAHLAGNLGEAERQAELGRTLGEEAGIDSTLPNYLLQMLSIRWDQGRLPELEAPLAMGAQRNPTNPGWTIAWRMAQLHGGSPAPARELIRSLAAQRFDALPRNVVFSALMAMLIDITVRLGDEDAARDLRELLVGMTRRHATVALGFCHWGALAGHLGRLDRLLGDLDAAAQHLEEGLTRDRALGAMSSVARGQIGLGRALAERGLPEDAARAGRLIAEGTALAADLDIAAR